MFKKMYEAFSAVSKVRLPGGKTIGLFDYIVRCYCTYLCVLYVVDKIDDMLRLRDTTFIEVSMRFVNCCKCFVYKILCTIRDAFLPISFVVRLVRWATAEEKEEC